MCDHRRTECYIRIAAGEVIINVRCGDCGLAPDIESMDLMALEALLHHSKQKALVAEQSTCFNANLN